METEKSKVKRMTDEEYKAWWRSFLDELRARPQDKLSPLAKHWLEMDGKEREWEMVGSWEEVFG